MSFEKQSGKRQRAGFTFAEILAAMFFMALVIPVAIEGLRVAARAGQAAERKSVAVNLAENMLNELVVTRQWQAGGTREGEFGDEWPGYRWELRNESWIEEPLRLVSVEVTYPVQDREYSVCVSTVAQDTRL